MSIIIVLIVLAYLGLVLLPAGLAVLVAIIKNAQSQQFWIAGTLYSLIVYWGMPFLLIREPPRVSPLLEILINNGFSLVSRGLVVVAVATLIFSLAQKKPNLPWLRGLTLGVGFASVYWLVLLFSG